MYVKQLFDTLELYLVILGTIGIIVTFGALLHFTTLRIGSVFSTVGITPREFCYIWCTLAHFMFGTPNPVGTVSVFVVLHSSFLALWDDSWSFSARLVHQLRFAHS